MKKLQTLGLAILLLLSAGAFGLINMNDTTANSQSYLNKKQN